MNATMTETRATGVVSMGMLESYIKGALKRLARKGVDERVGVYVHPDSTATIHVGGGPLEAVCVWEEPGVRRNDWIGASPWAWEAWFAAGRRAQMMARLRAAGLEPID